MKKVMVNLIAAVIIIGFSAWLYSNDTAARPGSLSSVHEMITDCETCHIPWQGVSDEMCLQCHYFGDVRDLKPQVRFHEAEKHCLDCHTEHLGTDAVISRVDHTLFNGERSCTDCHFDPHAQKFGTDCRACHGLSTWRIMGFRHPPNTEPECARCHAAPASHHNDAFWELIQKGHRQSVYDEQDRPPVEECRQCHTVHKWGHMMMGHGLATSVLP